MPPEDEISEHAAWKKILDVLPEDLHNLVKPVLKEWDQGVNERFRQIHKEYEPLKDFKDVDPEELKRGIYLLQQFEANPADVVKNAIDAFDLQDQFVDPSTIQQATVDPDDLDLDLDMNDNDILNHPMIKQMSEALEKMQADTEARQEQERAAAQQKEFEAQLEALKAEHGDFNPLVVTALIAQGVEGEEAVKAYKEAVNKAAADQLAQQNGNQQQNTAPPVVMGGDGTTGSGMPENGVDLGGMRKTDVNDLVVQMLEAQANQQ